MSLSYKGNETLIYRNVYRVISKFTFGIWGEKTMKSLWLFVWFSQYLNYHELDQKNNAFWATLWIAVIVGSNPTRFLPKALVLLWVLHLSLHSITCIWSRLNFDKSWVSVAINEGNCRDKRKEGIDSLMWVRFKLMTS